MVTYDELLQALVDIKTEEANAVWKQAGLMCLLVERHKAKPGDIASQLGCSASLVRDMVRTFKAFPNEEDRAIDRSFSIHKICAKTDDPLGWLDKALANGYSTRELQKVVKGEPIKDELRDAQSAWRKVEKIIDNGGVGAKWLLEQIKETVV